MEDQSYAKHTRLDPLFHFTLFPITALIFIGSLVNLYQSLDDHSRLYNASLISAIAFAMLWNGFLTRIYPLKAQDRAIRAEENLRHYVLTGKLMDRKLKLNQIVALRFSSDAEFPDLAAKASAMEPKEIKQAIKSWRADHERL